MQKRGNRSEIVLATKFTSPYKGSWDEYPIHANYAGNSAKSLKVSVNDSLKKLQTDYIDLLYVHWWYSPSASKFITFQGLYNFHRGIGSFSR